MAADWDQTEGELKEKAGGVLGDEDLETEGEVQGAWGDVKDTAGDAWDETTDKAQDAIEGGDEES